ncbi:excitatory amino acid transporter 3 [Culex quinquefasciatus]|uniref:Amino acid transporter n=2 Tax=Culex pipiens complex TaxID=518105 RepID=B0W0K5_CULQU|nr:excitatory amino acid transporter 3 [Culex quinquefasciatus]EDS41307.1 excitatory amino acid transporter 3 [Culex quinquefasciatus]|eukprot:XP_001842239.1 excitatory amino acid transporter 3 [Culex quinquefasciatus]
MVKFNKEGFLRFVKQNLLILMTIGGVVIGVALGLGLRDVGKDENLWTQRNIMYVNLLGDLFLRVIKAIILPLIVTSLISAVGSLDTNMSKKIGGLAILYYMTTTILAVLEGVALVITVQPGKRSDDKNDLAEAQRTNVTTADTLLDLIRNIFPPNLVQACLQQYQTVLSPPKANPSEQDLDLWDISSRFVDGTNLIGIVAASITFGVALSAVKNDAPVLLHFIQQLSVAVMKVTGWIIWLSPIGVLSLIAAKFLEMEDLAEVFGKLGLYFAVVVSGIVFHGVIVLPAIYFLLTRKNPYTFLLNMGQAIATAFGTSSSSATLPVTLQCLEEKNHIDTRITRFVIPIGTTINMDGTALYEAVAAIFIAQLRGIDLSFGQVLAVAITATAASIGTAAVPQGGLVTLVMVLDSIGLPSEDVSLIIALDWLVNRVRAVVNVLGDCFGAGIVAHYSRKDLENNPLESPKVIQDESSNELNNVTGKVNVS